MSSTEIESGLENLSLDLGFGFTDRLVAKTVKLTAVPQYTENYFLLRLQTLGCDSSNAPCPISWREAAQLPLCLLTPDMHNRAIVEDAFRQAGVKITPVIETNSIMALGLTVLSGKVCSILPGALVHMLKDYHELEALPLRAPEVLTPIGFMYPFNDRPSHALRAALNMASDPAWLQIVAENIGLQSLELPQLRAAAVRPQRDKT
jgi:DNA-binding transcriptional LysR family regulator